MKENLTSKKNIIVFGFQLLTIVGLFGFIGILGIVKTIKDIETGNFWTKNITLPVIFIPIALYSIYYFLTNFPSFRIDRKGIEVSTLFKSQKINWNELERIELTGKQPFRFLFLSMPIEATTIHLNNNTEIYLWVDYYRNKSELRIILDRANNILQDDKNFSTLDFNIIKPDKSKYLPNLKEGKEYNGNHFLTVNGFIFYGWLFLFTYLIFDLDKKFLNSNAVLFFIPLSLLSIPALLSYQMHYFIIGQEYLVIKNTIWFWKKDIYLLSDIKEIVIEMPYRRSVSLRVITNDYRDKLYPAGNLNNKTWSALMERLLGDGIKVRNEEI